MNNKGTTIVLLVLITLAALWATGRLQKVFSVVFL